MSLTIEGLLSFFRNQNVEAFSHCVRHSESHNKNDDAYRIMFGGALAPDLSRHPRKSIQSPWGWTSAAGAYQAMCATPDGRVSTDTWGDFCRALGRAADDVPFDKDTQDAFYVWCLRRRNALQLVIDGRIRDAITECSYEWASFPPGRYGQPTVTYEALERVYVEYGGRLSAYDTQPTVSKPAETTQQPQAKAQSMPLPIIALISAFGPLLAQLIPTVAKAFDKTSDTPAKIEAATKIIETVVTATNSTNVQEAVEKMQSDPVVLTTARNAVVTEPEIMTLLEIGGGIDAARSANLEAQLATKSFLHNPALWITLVLLVFPSMLLADVFYVHPDSYSGELRTQIVTGIMGIILVVCGYWLGTSAGSMRKTDIIANQQAQK